MYCPMSERQLVIFCGPPCSGKSTLARKIQEETGFKSLGLDEIQSRLIPKSTHTNEERDIAYREMHRMAERLLVTGFNVILDATYARPKMLDDLQKLIFATNVAAFTLQCRVDPATAIERFWVRLGGHQARDLTAARVQRLAQEFHYRSFGLTVDTTRSREESLVLIRAYLDGKPRG